MIGIMLRETVRERERERERSERARERERENISSWLSVEQEMGIQEQILN